MAEKKSSVSKAKYIQRMFTELMPRYDAVSTAIAFNRDAFWRDFTTSLVDGDGEQILDVCCGTGELSIRLLDKNGGRVFAFDFCEAMARGAKKKYGDKSGIYFGVADVENLPFQDETFTCVTVAFALRNVTNIRRSIFEMARVLRKGGKMIILDLGKPKAHLFRKAYYLYFYKIAPKLGGALTKQGGYAYKYLPQSLTNYPAQDGIKKIMTQLGLEDVKVHNLSMGIASVHEGSKPQ
jgi:demethylmenaquinone methyltransferase/2-methoxy-6-polyprenyl-1,4-benzoquinol methylase